MALYVNGQEKKCFVNGQQMSGYVNGVKMFGAAETPQFGLITKNKAVFRFFNGVASKTTTRFECDVITDTSLNALFIDGGGWYLYRSPLGNLKLTVPNSSNIETIPISINTRTKIAVEYDNNSRRAHVSVNNASRDIVYGSGTTNFGDVTAKNIPTLSNLTTQWTWLNAKLFEDGVLKFNWIPVPVGSMKYSGIPAPSNCFWDTVSSQYVESITAGQPEIIEV